MIQDGEGPNEGANATFKDVAFKDPSQVKVGDRVIGEDGDAFIVKAIKTDGDMVIFEGDNELSFFESYKGWPVPVVTTPRETAAAALTRSAASWGSK